VHAYFPTDIYWCVRTVHRETAGDTSCGDVAQRIGYADGLCYEGSAFSFDFDCESGSTIQKVYTPSQTCTGSSTTSINHGAACEISDDGNNDDDDDFSPAFINTPPSASGTPFPTTTAEGEGSYQWACVDQSSIAPTASPTRTPTAPTAMPTPNPSAEPTVEPTVIPTAMPTPNPSVEPTVEPTMIPTAAPTTLLEISSTHDMDGISESEYEANQAAVNETIVESIADTVDGVEEEDITSISPKASSRLRRSLASGDSLSLDIQFRLLGSGLSFADVSDNLVEAVESGNLTATIQQKAADKGVSVLSNVTVTGVTTTDVTPTDGDEGGDSGDDGLSDGVLAAIIVAAVLAALIGVGIVIYLHSTKAKKVMAVN